MEVCIFSMVGGIKWLLLSTSTIHSLVCKKRNAPIQKGFHPNISAEGFKANRGQRLERREQAQAIGSKISLRLSSWQTETTQRSKVLSDIKKNLGKLQKLLLLSAAVPPCAACSYNDPLFCCPCFCFVSGYKLHLKSLDSWCVKKECSFYAFYLLADSDVSP